MTSHSDRGVGYTFALLLASAVLLLAVFLSYQQGLWHQVACPRVAPITPLAIALLLVCSVWFWMYPSGVAQLFIYPSRAAHLHAMTALTGCYAMYWGLWNFELTRHLQDHPIKSAVICVFSGITSAFCLIAATAYRFSDLSAVTALAGSTIFMGMQGMAITMYLHKCLEEKKYKMRRSPQPCMQQEQVQHA